MRKFYAKSRASGTCSKCRTTIEKGQPAWWSQGRGWRCTQCQPASEEQPQQSPAPQAEPKRPSETFLARIDESEGRYQVEFDRMIDAVETAGSFGRGNLDNRDFFDKNLKAHERTGWLNRRTIESTKQFLREGKAELTELVERMRREIAGELAVPSSTKRRMRRGRESGDEIGVDRFLDRVPEMWDRIETERTPANRVVVTINAAVSASEKQDNLAYRAAAAIALADALTERGASVEVRLQFCASRPTDEVLDYVSTVVVKRSDQPMSIADLAAGCCDIGAVRLALVMGTSRLLRGTLKEELGSPIPIPADRRVGDYVVDRDVTSRWAAVRWVNEAIRNFEQR